MYKNDLEKLLYHTVCVTKNSVVKLLLQCYVAAVIHYSS